MPLLRYSVFGIAAFVCEGQHGERSKERVPTSGTNTRSRAREDAAVSSAHRTTARARRLDATARRVPPAAARRGTERA